MICNKLTRRQAIDLYAGVVEDKDRDSIRELCCNDLFFLLLVVCNRKDVNRDWLYDRCRQVERSPDGHLDLWAREHYKSTIITFGKTMQDILVNPELTVGIFSHTRPVAKGFLDQIKREFEGNSLLKEVFPDVLYKEPRRQSPRWAVDAGIIVKRKTNPKEATVEAWGLVDSQPIGKHFGLMVYDDVVTPESVSSWEQMQKTTDAWALSLNLGSQGGRRRYIGTRYHFNDTYKVMLERQTATPRIHPATKDGSVSGKPVLLSREDLDKKREDMGQYIFACQLLLNPVEDSAMGFKFEWLHYYDRVENVRNWNIYVLCDPAGEKKKVNDYSVMLVIGLAPDQNYYLLDGVRDRLDVVERTELLFKFRDKWLPKKVGYEKYGMQADLRHIKYVQEEKNHRFTVAPLSGNMAKNDRIRRLVPLFEQGRFYLPHKLLFRDRDGKTRDLVKEFIDQEFIAFPVGTHDDILDCMSRIEDPDFGATMPKKIGDMNGFSGSMFSSKVKTDYDLYDERGM